MKVKAIAFAAAAALAALFGSASAAHAWSYQSSGQWASVNYGTWTVYQDEWGSTAPCMLYANSASNFAGAGSWTGGGVKTYPHAQAYPRLPLGQNHWCTSNFNVSSPSWGGNLSYDFTYDLWPTNSVDEVMVLENLYPGAGGGWGSKIASNVTIGGNTFDVWQANPGWNVIQFIPKSMSWSRSEDLYGLMNWCYWNGRLRNNVFDQVAFGCEITSTNGWQQFTVNQFWCGWQ